MPKYINLERARFEAERYFQSMDEIKEDLDTLFCMLQTEDVAPVRHGLWIEGEDEYGLLLTCSVCGEEFVSWEADCARTNYCPNCGADMRGINDE